MLSEDWERAILARNNNDSDHLPKKSGLFKSNKTPAQVKYTQKKEGEEQKDEQNKGYF